MKSYKNLNIYKNDIYTIDYSLLEKCDNKNIWKIWINLKTDSNSNNHYFSIDSENRSEDEYKENAENNMLVITHILNQNIKLNKNIIKLNLFYIIDLS